MRQEPLFVNEIWLTSGELARYEYVAELVPSDTVARREAGSYAKECWSNGVPELWAAKLVRRRNWAKRLVTKMPSRGPPELDSETRSPTSSKVSVQTVAPLVMAVCRPRRS